MSDETNFGRTPKLTPDQREIRDAPTTASENAGNNILTEWEEEFVLSCLESKSSEGETTGFHQKSKKPS
jgi:hypothetical protein